MKILHGVRVTFWGQKRHKRNRQKVWEKAHQSAWNIFGFLTGRGVEEKPFKDKYMTRPQRHLRAGKTMSFLAKMRRRRSYVG